VTDDIAAIVLAGGESRRMGSDKSLLDWHGSTMLSRVTGILRRVADPVVVVTAPDRATETGAGVEVAFDRASGRGPLEGIAAGLRAVGDRRQAAFVAAVDMPFLHPAFVEGLAALLGDADVALPEATGHRHPTAAVYRTAMLPVLERLLESGRREPAELFARVCVRVVEPAELTEPSSLENLNTLEDYRAALERPLPRVTVGGRRAAGAILSDVWDRPGAVLLNGAVMEAVPTLPLVDGDVIDQAAA
jgi:molybdopterin-guanine dinucleotide biosynthesis protein A